jgi:gamma-glutamylcyclotransferase (GGCT)/AIG2-like uncharacterized protein YtfP
LNRKFPVFAYGSLLKGFEANDTFLKNADYMGKAKVKGFLRCTTSDYPILIVDEEKGEFVSGELYLVDYETMDRLRKYEGVGSIFTLYTEKYVNLYNNEMKRVRAFVAPSILSFPLKLTSKPVKGGDWLEFISARHIFIPKRLILTLSICIYLGIHFLV